MNDVFENRVRAAAVAGWWTVLIAIAFITLQWIIYLVVTEARPSWLLSMWGPGRIGPWSRRCGYGPSSSSSSSCG